MMLLNLRQPNYTASHSSASLFTMLALAEEEFCGSTSSLFLQIYKKIAAKRKTISPMRPKMAGTFIVLFCSLLWHRISNFVFVLPLIVPLCFLAQSCDFQNCTCKPQSICNLSKMFSLQVKCLVVKSQRTWHCKVLRQQTRLQNQMLR